MGQNVAAGTAWEWGPARLWQRWVAGVQVLVGAERGAKMPSNHPTRPLSHPPPLCVPGYSYRLLGPRVACLFHIDSRSVKTSLWAPKGPYSAAILLQPKKHPARAAPHVSEADRAGFVWSAVWLYSAAILLQKVNTLAARPPASAGKKRWVCVVSCLVLSPLQRAHAWVMVLATLRAGEKRGRGGCPRIPTLEPRTSAM